MGSSKEPAQTRSGRKSGKSVPSPDWADGLKTLYDAVVEEPLPDSFKDLLDKLDEQSDGPS